MSAEMTSRSMPSRGTKYSFCRVAGAPVGGGFRDDLDIVVVGEECGRTDTESGEGEERVCRWEDDEAEKTPEEAEVGAGEGEGDGGREEERSEEAASEEGGG